MTKYPQLRDDDGAEDPRKPNSCAGDLDLPENLSAIDIFRQLFADCMPKNTSYRGARNWQAGYRRMVVIAFVSVPELFVGMTQAQVAFAVGMHVVAFRRLQRDVEAQLAARATTARQRGPRRKL